MTRLGRAAERLPWWLVLVLASGCVVLGGVLIADPFRSLDVLAWVAGAALVVSGVAELSASGASTRPWLSRFAGLAWLLAGVLALAVPDLTIRALAFVAGIGLLLGGAAKLAAALAGTGEERAVDGLTGATTLVVGALALAFLRRRTR